MARPATLAGFWTHHESVRWRSYAPVMEIASAYIFGLIGAGFAARLLWPKRR